MSDHDPRYRRTTPGASLGTLLRRMIYGGRKARNALRRLRAGLQVEVEIFPDEWFPGFVRFRGAKAATLRNLKRENFPELFYGSGADGSGGQAGQSEETCAVTA